MDAAAAIRISLETAEMIGLAVLERFKRLGIDAPPPPRLQPHNWQVGHLVLSEHEMMRQIAPESVPDLSSWFRKYLWQRVSQPG